MESEQSTTYKNRTVVCSANYETIGFMPRAMVSWTPSSGTTTIFLKSCKSYSSEEAALIAALEEAKCWIDKQLPD